MAKSATQQDLEQRIVDSEPTANRVGDAACLLAAVLLRHDTRAQRAYDDWLACAIRYEDAGAFTEDAVLRFLFESSVQLNALVRELKLQRYQNWLPRALLWEFYRALECADRVKMTVPRRLPWLTPGKRPKQRAGAMGGFRLENLEQHIERFYLCVVQNPPVPKKRLAVLQTCARADVQHSVKRARILLDCLNAPLPSSHSS